ncbi:CPLD17 [Auxenochlorella protothecoides x Auxenochlorella symbiontica]
MSMQVIRILGDGRCMYRALVRGLHLAQNKPLQPSEETNQADALRRRVCDELGKRREDFEPFIDCDFDAYVRDQRRPSAWGGEPELACAATVLECAIQVYQQSPQGGLGLISQYGELAKGGSRPPAINLLFHRLGHYDLLMPGQIQSKL